MPELDAVYRGWSAYFGDHPEIWRRSPADRLSDLATAGDLRLLVRWFEGGEKVRAGNTALIGVLDVDVAKRALDRHPVAADLLGRALAVALRLRRQLEERGAAALLEASGYKGYHLWIRLAEPVACYRLRRWLLDVVRAIGPLPADVRVEEFPNRDRVRPEKIGPLIKLPLGVHAKTGRRCDLLDDRGEPLADPFAAIRSLPPVAAETLSPPPAPAPGADGGEERPQIGPRAQKLLASCRVLGHLARQAETTSYLDHRQRYTLLCVLGHLGEEGSAALHAIISHTYNYKKEVTDRHIARLPASPMS